MDGGKSAEGKNESKRVKRTSTEIIVSTTSWKKNKPIQIISLWVGNRDVYAYQLGSSHAKKNGILGKFFAL